MKNREKVERVYDEIHAPEALVWKVMDMSKEMKTKEFKTRNVVKYAVCTLAVVVATFAASNGIAFIDAAISNSGFWASSFMVNYCKLKYSQESPLNYYIETNAHGMTTLYENNDLAHYDSNSMLLLGRLYGQMISKVID